MTDPKRQQLTCARCGRTGSQGYTKEQDGTVLCKGTKACLARVAKKEGRPPKHQQKRKDAADERAAEILRLKRQGLRQDTIAVAVGLTPGRVSQVISEHYAALRTKASEDAMALRDLELDRIDHLYEQLAPFSVRTPLFHPETGQPLTYRDGHAAEGPPSIAAITELRRLSETRRKLLGLDAPEKREHSGPGGAPIQYEHAPMAPDKAAEVLRVLTKVGALKGLEAASQN